MRDMHRNPKCCPKAMQQRMSNLVEAALGAWKNVFLSTLLCAPLLWGEPSPTFAAPPTASQVIVEVSESSYPLLKALTKETFVPLSTKLEQTILDIKPDKLAKAIDLGVDAFNSVPTEAVNTFTGNIEEAFAKLRTDSCTLVPLPDPILADRFKALAAQNVDEIKLKKFQGTWGKTLKALSKTEDAICLPSVEDLDKLALAQADIGRSFGAEETKKFATYVEPLAKQSFPIGKILPLIGDFKRQAPTATAQEKARFQAAGKQAETLAKTSSAQKAMPEAASQREHRQSMTSGVTPAAAPRATATPAAATPAAKPEKEAQQKEEQVLDADEGVVDNAANDGDSLAPDVDKGKDKRKGKEERRAEKRKRQEEEAENRRLQRERRRQRKVVVLDD